MTFIGTPTFSYANVVCDYSSVTSYTSQPTGAVTGTKYAVAANGAINVYGGGANYLQGTVAGVVTTGGIYG